MILLGSLIEVKEEQSSKALPPIEVIPSGRLMELNEEQSANV